MTADWIANARAAMMDPMVTYKEDATERLPLALDALEKVLELHYRRAWSVLSGDHMSFAQTEFPDQCDHCRRAYPCPTVVLIREALDVSD